VLAIYPLRFVFFDLKSDRNVGTKAIATDLKSFPVVGKFNGGLGFLLSENSRFFIFKYRLEYPRFHKLKTIALHAREQETGNRKQRV
jgi:hypothetical protein